MKNLFILTITLATLFATFSANATRGFDIKVKLLYPNGKRIGNTGKITVIANRDCDSHLEYTLMADGGGSTNSYGCAILSSTGYGYHLEMVLSREVLKMIGLEVTQKLSESERKKILHELEVGKMPNRWGGFFYDSLVEVNLNYGSGPEHAIDEISVGKYTLQVKTTNRIYR